MAVPKKDSDVMASQGGKKGGKKNKKTVAVEMKAGFYWAQFILNYKY